MWTTAKTCIILIFLTPLLVQDTTASPLTLSPDEKEWLAKHKTIRVSGPQAFPPFQYIDKDNTFKGMASDYLTYIAEKLDLEFVIAKKLPWAEILEKVKNKEIDLLSCAAITEERKSYLSFTNTLLSFPLVIVSRKDAPFINDIYSLHKHTIAQVKNNATDDWMREKGVEFTPLIVSSPLHGLEAVSLGKADAVIENLAAASYLIEKEGLTNLKIAAPTPFGNYALSIGIRKDWPELVSIMNKVLATIPQEKHNEIRQKWISVRYEHGISPMDIVRWVMGVLVIATLLVTAFYLWNRKLAKEIRIRKQAEAEKEKLIEELKTALDEIKTLRGILPICSQCKKIRDDHGYWTRIETYIGEHSEADFSHSICPECSKELYGHEKWYEQSKDSEESGH